MRYGHMVRKYDLALPGEYNPKPARKFTPLSKHAITVALDFRSLICSLRSPRLVLLLILTPFVFALFVAIARPRPKRADVTASVAVPESFQKYGYEQIRAGTTVPMQAREKIELAAYQKSLGERRKKKVDGETSISLIAACKNRRESMALALASWEGVKEIDEIVIVDWGSEEWDWERLPLLDSLVRDGRVSFVQVEDPGEWALTRAYNLAAKVATGKYLLKVDCDTHLKDSFIQKHPRPQAGKYYSLGWGTERNENEGKLRGVWFASRADFDKVGGYDERIVAYGYEENDLYERFDRIAGLESKYLELDALQHSVAGDVIWVPKGQNGTSHAVSTRMNRAIIKTLPAWPDIATKGEVMQYQFAYANKNGYLFATIDKSIPSAQDSTTPEDRTRIKREVLETALHDEFNIPWDVIPSLTPDDLEYLATYLDKHGETHVAVVSLNGPDAISNVFNLVSAIELGMSIQRPVIAIWGGSDPEFAIDQSNGPAIRQLFDLEATNELLEQAAESETAQKLSMTVPTRLMAAKEFPCVQELTECAEKYDRAYDSFAELKMDIRHSYDHTDRVPLSPRRHGLIRLANKTRIGSEETRALAFNSLVQSHMVREHQKLFAETARVGIVSDASTVVADLTSDVRSKHGGAVGPEVQEMVPIVGQGHHSIRRELFGEEKGRGFCEWKKCNVQMLAREVANVLAMCSASEVYPAVEAADKQAWATRRDFTKMMVADLRVLQRKRND